MVARYCGHWYMAKVSIVLLDGDGTNVETAVLSGLVGLEITEFSG